MKHINKALEVCREVRAIRREIIGAAILTGLIAPLIAHAVWTHYDIGAPIEYTAEKAHAEEIVEKPVQIVAKIDWEDKERVKKEVAKWAEVYGANETQMNVTINCESQHNVKAHNPKDPYGGAHGVGQFLKPTFYHYAPLAGVENPDINNPEHQIHTMAYMFSIGEAKQWTCWKMKYAPWLLPKGFK